jgi:hypothetical protein
LAPPRKAGAGDLALIALGKKSRPTPLLVVKVEAPAALGNGGRPNDPFCAPSAMAETGAGFEVKLGTEGALPLVGVNGPTFDFPLSSSGTRGGSGVAASAAPGEPKVGAAGKVRED